MPRKVRQGKLLFVLRVHSFANVCIYIIKLMEAWTGKHNAGILFILLFIIKYSTG